MASWLPSPTTKGDESMIAIKKILVPVDLSGVSAPAIEYAASLARAHDAEVILFHVIPVEKLKDGFAEGYGDGLLFSAETSMSVRRQSGFEDTYETKKQLLLGFLQQKIAPEVRKMVKVRAVVKPGRVFEEIVVGAREEQSDLIVMTSRGASLRRLFGRSITERIVRHAPCPVLSMQPSAEVRTENDERLQVKVIEQRAA